MLIFLDTEFTDFIDCELISIGMVSEDGQHAFYAEVLDLDRAKSGHRGPFDTSQAVLKLAKLVRRFSRVDRRPYVDKG